MKLPVSAIIKETKSPLRGVSGLEFFNAYKTLLGREPERNNEGTCIYSYEDVCAVLSESTEFRLRELEEWKKELPLADSLTRASAIRRLVAIGNSGWLIRCKYTRGKLMLCRADAEQLCYLRKSGYGFERPLRWAI